MEDIGVAAFSVFFMQSPSFLAHQKALEEMRGRSNANTLFGMTKIPSDNHIRQMLDGVPTDHFDAVFQHIVRDLEGSGGLKPLRRLGGRTLIALDGSEHFCSRKVHCPRCSTRKRSDGETEYFHSFVGATLVAPGHATVVPLPPEFVRPQDGAKKQDCEPNAARRWLSRLGPHYAWLNPVYLGDDIYARQPMCADVLAVGGSFIFGCKPSSHKTLTEYLTGVPLEEFSETVGVGSAKRIHRHRWMKDVPLRDGKDALAVNWLEIEISKPSGKVTYRNSFVTNLAVNRQSAAEIAACGRARWKIENETFNVLKNNGYNLEHNFGHGKDTLASLLVSLNLLAFAMHNACDLAEAQWQDGRQKVGAKMRLFEHIRTITAYLVFPSWGSLFRTIRTGRPPPQPP
ncbi:MAG: transposase [Alphaproteobacteria bacterium]|nr:transposase [Alphaproteobacteria bacterium]MBF0333456.1 transposase [Alphaproteobacteria bacterium]